MKKSPAKFWRSLLRWKSKLPANGDWLFVTEELSEEPSTGETGQDLSARYDEYQNLVEDTKALQSEPAIKFFYEKAKEFENWVYKGRADIRDKAKVLLGAASFVSAILATSVSIIANSVSMQTAWARLVCAGIVTLMGAHFLRAIYVALGLLIREESVTTSLPEMIKACSADENEALKILATKTIHYANLTDTVVLRQGNRLIVSQHAFRWGLLYAFLLTVLCVFYFTHHPKADPTGRVVSAVESVNTSISSLEKEVSTRLDQVSGSTQTVQKEIESLRRDVSSGAATLGDAIRVRQAKKECEP